MNEAELARLNQADGLIQEIAADLGLTFFPQEFDVIPAQKMLEIMAYRLPVNFSHWSFGRDYESERTKHEHGFAVPYEVVFNSDPCRGYLMDTNPFPIQVMVMAHVYAHNDFMKNSVHFQHTRRDMITSASAAAARFRQYEEDYGQEEGGEAHRRRDVHPVEHRPGRSPPSRVRGGGPGEIVRPGQEKARPGALCRPSAPPKRRSRLK